MKKICFMFLTACSLFMFSGIAVAGPHHGPGPGPGHSAAPAHHAKPAPARCECAGRPGCPCDNRGHMAPPPKPVHVPPPARHGYSPVHHVRPLPPPPPRMDERCRHDCRVNENMCKANPFRNPHRCEADARYCIDHCWIR